MEKQKAIAMLAKRAKLNPDSEGAISEQLTIFISKEWWKGLSIKPHACKVAKTCRMIMKKTNHYATYRLCEAISNQVKAGNYQGAMDGVDEGRKVYESYVNQSSETSPK